MKFLKGLLIVILSLAGLVLLIPVFMPSVTTVSVEKEVALKPAQVFKNAAVFHDRDKWDPWLKMEPEAKVTITPQEGYIGSTYEWIGEKIGSGKMRVDSIVYGEFIGSSIWFAGSEDASKVEWILEEAEGGTLVTWKFISEGAYPFGRWMNVFMKGMLSKSFESGMADFKTYLEENPPLEYWHSEIVIDELDGINSMVIPAYGTMEEIGAQMQEKYPLLYMEIGKQGLNPVGPPFAYYLDYDMETGISNVLLGAQVDKAGKASGDVKVKVFPAMKAVVAMHHGAYDYFQDTYASLMEYVSLNGVDVSGEAFEIYLKSMRQSTDPADWETLIGFPLK